MAPGEELRSAGSGSQPDDGPRRLEPGSPRFGNVVFVVLGVLLALFVMARGLGLV